MFGHAYAADEQLTAVKVNEDRIGGVSVRGAMPPRGGRGLRTIWIEIGAATATGINDANGNPVQWTYAAIEVEKSSGGYGGWATKSGGWSGTAYNGAEDENASGARQKSTGVDHGGTDYPSTFEMQAIQPGVKVLASLVEVGGTVEAWFTMANGEDGTCE